MKKDPRVYLAHILECAEKIEAYTRGGEKEFLRSSLIQDALIRNFEVIGEAPKRIQDEFRAKTPTIPWKLMAGFRDVLIHQYEGVDLQRVWHIAKKDLLDVKKAIVEFLPPLEDLEREIAGEADPND